MIEGARRIGKSTIVEEFAKKEYDSYILIDFNRASAAVIALFDDLMDLDYIFLSLQTIYHKTLKERKSLIIFDEVQRCPKARQAIKYLVSDGRYDYIETGSLISIKRNTENITIPSEEVRLPMYPMDYEEFRWALKDEASVPALKKFFEFWFTPLQFLIGFYGFWVRVRIVKFKITLYFVQPSIFRATSCRFCATLNVFRATSRVFRATLNVFRATFAFFCQGIYSDFFNFHFRLFTTFF